VADQHGVEAALLGADRVVDGLRRAAELGDAVEREVRRADSADRVLGASGRNLRELGPQPLEVGRVELGVDEALVPDAHGSHI
jgi:hypothetical protein